MVLSNGWVVSSGVKLVNCFLSMRIVVAKDNVFIGRIDMLDVGLLEDGLGFPVEGDD